MRAIAAAFALGTIVAAQTPPTAAVFSRLDTYLDKYESDLGAVVADEQMQQSISNRFAPDEQRKLTSEVAFLRLPGNLEWLGFRRVHTVDGNPVPAGAATLMQLLTGQSADPIAQGQLLADASARYNLGSPRTVNMPNLPLELLNAKYRHRYTTRLDGTAHVRGRLADIVELMEIGPPPIVYNGGRNLKSLVRAWVDRQHGALWRAEVRLHGEGERRPTVIRVEFADDRSLRIIVPIEMREEFHGTVGGAGRGEARYSNFRRFQTSARIVPR